MLNFLYDIVSILPKLTYYLTVAAMSLMDIVQLLLRKMAGLDAYYIGESSQSITGDIALSFLRGIFEKNSQFPALKNAFWALTIIAVILLVVSTIIAIIRQEYMPRDDEAKEKPSNNKLGIISRSVKSLFLFLIVPVSAIFGLMLSDIFLVAIDSATTSAEVGGALLSNSQITQGTEIEINGQTQFVGGLVSAEVNGQMTYKYLDIFGFGDFPTTTISFSGLIFKSSAYIANRARTDKTFAVPKTIGPAEIKTYAQLIDDGDISHFNIFNKGTTHAEIAQIIDEAFAANVKLKTPEKLKSSGVASNFFSTVVFSYRDKVSHFSKFNVGLVWYYYDLWQFNFLVAFAFLIVCLKLLVKIVTGIMKRIIELVALFIISPPIIAIMPLDGGSAFGEWRKKFISRAISIYGAIIGMNLFFLVLPYLNEIKFFSVEAMPWLTWDGTGAIYIINLMVSTIFIVAGLVTVEGFIELLSGIVGSESLAKTGGEMVGKIGDTIAKSARMTGAVAGVGTSAALLPIKATGIDKLAVKAGRGVNKAIRRGIAFGGNKGEKAREDIEKKWNEGGAQKAYNELLDENAKYSELMSSAFASRKTGKKMSFDDWRDKTKEGKQASLDAIDVANKTGGSQIQSFDKFKDIITTNKKGNLVISKAFKKYEKSEMDSQSKTYGDAFSIRREAIASSGSKWAKGFSNAGQAVGKSLLQIGKHANAYASNFGPMMTDAFERTGKHGFMSMVMAFQGKKFKDIEFAETRAKSESEEKAKAMINEEVRAKQAAKEKADKAKEIANKIKADDAAKKIKELEDKISEISKKMKK